MYLPLGYLARRPIKVLQTATNKDHRHFRSRLHVIVLEHVWDQLFTVDTIWNIGETGDIYATKESFVVFWIFEEGRREKKIPYFCKGEKWSSIHL